MHRQGIEDFPYYLGIRSLADIATREDRVCVLNIAGGESRQVTPVSHAFSGGNVVFGTSPGRAGQRLKTPAGDIPVFNNVREGLDAGHAFNTGVVYLPPSGVRDGVAELIRVNDALQKIVIITEKVAVHDAREIRAMAQANGELVQALYDAGASPYVFCVNVDAVIAALLLALLWDDFTAGRLSERDLKTAAFTVFLYGRMIGAAAEIDDHLNRGRNMDTRTPASACAHVV